MAVKTEPGLQTRSLKNLRFFRRGFLLSEGENPVAFPGKKQYTEPHNRKKEAQLYEYGFQTQDDHPRGAEAAVSLSLIHI